MAVPPSLVWAFVAVLALWRTELLIRLFLGREDKRLAAAVSAVKVEVPQDLQEVALEESEPWAREEALDAMRDLYRISGDWNTVRRHHSVGQIEA